MIEGVNCDTPLCDQPVISVVLVREREEKKSWPLFCQIFGWRKVLVFLCEVLVWSIAVHTQALSNIQQDSFLENKSHSRLTTICHCFLFLWKIKYSSLLWFEGSEDLSGRCSFMKSSFLYPVKDFVRPQPPPFPAPAISGLLHLERKKHRGKSDLYSIPLWFKSHDKIMPLQLFQCYASEFLPASRTLQNGVYASSGCSEN